MELPKSTGFTMTELAVVMGIVAILVAIALPSYRSVTTSNRIASEINGLLGDMQFARGEAIKQGQTVTVCVSADGATCANSTAWQTGWIVFSDSNGNQAVDANEPVLRVQQAFTGTDSFQADNNIKAVTFNREGFAPTGVAGPVTISLHDTVTNAASYTRCLAISAFAGSLTTQTAGIGNCT
jgi:type IV fimbrial biogenesis protein FimT